MQSFVCEPTNRELIAAHMGWVFFQIEVEDLRYIQA